MDQIRSIYFSEWLHGRRLRSMKNGWTVFLIVLVGCSSPTAPSSPPAAVAPSTPTITISGFVVGVPDRRPLSGVSVTIAFSGQQTTTDSNGLFRLTFTPRIVSTTTLNFAGPSIIARADDVPNVNGGVTTHEVIALTSQFDRAFYRQLIHNAFESPNQLEPLRRQAEAPRIYLRTVDEAGAQIDSLTLNQTAAALENTAGSLTGVFGLAGIERGTADRFGQRGWITVVWSSQVDPGACGRAFVGGDTVVLYLRGRNCRCAGGPAVRLVTIKHELGHALGLWHTDSPNDLMGSGGQNVCDMNPSARELYHSRIAYSMPIGSPAP